MREARVTMDRVYQLDTDEELLSFVTELSSLYSNLDGARSDKVGGKAFPVRPGVRPGFNGRIFSPKYPCKSTLGGGMSCA